MKKSQHVDSTADQTENHLQVDVPTLEIPESVPKKARPHHRLRAWLGRFSKKQWALIIVSILLIKLGLLFLTPVGYPVIGRFFTQNVTINAADGTFRLNISDVGISLDGSSQEFKGEGPFTLNNVPAGKHTVTISKQYYKSETLHFTIKPLSRRSKSLALNASLTPTGRPILVTITDTLTRKPLEGVTLAQEKTESTTNDKGEATVVLASSANEGKITLKKEGYNTAEATIIVDGDTTNKLSLTPSGAVYFLSKRSGKIDLYRSNLDGSEQQVALAATGNESDSTQMLSSPNRQWIALLSSRDGQRSPGGTLLSKVFIYDTTSGRLVAADEGVATFGLIGWTKNNTLVYTVDTYVDYSGEYRVAGRNKVKLYNPSTNQIALLYSNTVTPPEYKEEYYTQYPYPKAFYGTVDNLYSTYLLRDYVVTAYSSGTFNSSYDYYRGGEVYPAVYKFQINALDGALVRTIEKTSYPNMSLLANNMIAFDIDNTYYTYDVAANKEAKATKPATAAILPLYSPDGQQTTWIENRDGQNIIFIGDAEMKNPKQLYAKTGMTVYDWYGNDAVLLFNSDDESALYIMSLQGTEPIKISNIHSYNSNYYNGY